MKLYIPLLLIGLNLLFSNQDDFHSPIIFGNQIKDLADDSTSKKIETVGLSNNSNNMYVYYGFLTHHITEWNANNDNDAKGIIYKHWLFGHSINSSGNHSFMLGRLFVIKQKYLTNSIFAEFKFSVAIASGYGNGGNLPGNAGLMMGFVPSLSMGYRIKPDLEASIQFIYIPTPYIGVLNIGLGFRKVL